MTVSLALLAGAAAGLFSFAPNKDVSLMTPGCGPAADCANAPFAVVAGDFNDDGAIDVATANSASHNVTISLGDALGNLAAAANQPVGRRPTTLAAGFLDADDTLDLVVANANDGSVSILLGNGDATFTPLGELSVGLAPAGVVLGYFDCDSNLDIATADLFGTTPGSTLESTVSILLGKGNGRFAAAIPIHAPGGPVGIATGFINGDQIADLTVTLSARDQIAVLIGRGDGTFTSSANVAVGNLPVAVILADLDRNGHADVAVANEFDDSVSVLLGDGQGAFEPTQPLTAGLSPVDVAAADLDGDGAPDLVTVDSAGSAGLPTGSVSVFMGDGQGGFAAAQRFATGPSPFSLTLVDLDSDHVTDVVTANLDGDSLSILTNLNETPPPTGTPARSPTPTSVADLDVDGNGRIDSCTDLTYVARRLTGLPPVPPSFRQLDPSIRPDAEIETRVDALGDRLDVDASGDVDVAADLVYIARRVLGLPPVPGSFRKLDASIPPDAEIIGRVDPLLS